MYEPWADDFAAFAEWIVAHLGWPPTPDHELDRIDNDGNYEPGNLQWLTREENLRKQHRDKVAA
jgi:hypothetical protein